MLALSAGHALAAGTPGDPWEKFNRRGFAIQIKIDRWVIGPLGLVWRMLTPGVIGKAIHNFLTNLDEPVIAINNTLQLRPGRAARSVFRLAINTTLGVGGLIDVAGNSGTPQRKSSFGDTLARYGVGPGPYLFLPMVGPSGVRDLFGNGVDAVIDPLHFARYPYREDVGLGLTVTDGLDQFVRSEDDLRHLLGDAADPYATLRSTYLQHRKGQIEGETVKPEALPDLDTLAPAGEAPPAGPVATPPSAAPEAPSGEAVAGQGQAPALETLPGDEHGNPDDHVAGPPH
jgi:phospholipid-binding lipoprotein MlaA